MDDIKKNKIIWQLIIAGIIIVTGISLDILVAVLANIIK